jgi:hypothetical protein
MPPVAFSSVAMAPETRYNAFTPHAHVDTINLSSQQISLALPYDTLALVLEQMSLIYARLDAQTTGIVAVVAAAAADPPCCSAAH